MRRYRFLTKDYIFEALNKLRASFLAAKDGSDVEEIIKGILTHDERMRIGRRIQIAQMLKNGFTYREIANTLKVGIPTIRLVAKKMEENPRCYELINEREDKVEKEYRKKAYTKVGSSLQLHKRTEYTGFERKDVKR